jgi:hypothetical protein
VAVSDSKGASIIWKHDQEGTYWVNIFTEDGKGGAAAFSFSITVLSDEDDLNVRFYFNAFPTVITSVKNEMDVARSKRFSRRTITLDATGSTDPDGDRVSYLWTTDCVFAKMAGAPTAKKVALIAKKEEACTATVHVFDTLGYNEATVPLDICCQQDTQRCGICNSSQPRVRTDQAGLQLSSQATAQETPVTTGCSDTSSGAAQADAPVAAGSQANANGMCRI